MSLWPLEVNPIARAWGDAKREGGAMATGVQAHEEYQGRTLDWIVDKLGVERETLLWSALPAFDGHAWDGSADPLAQIATALDEWEDIGAESGTGTGKSFFLACCILAFLAQWKGGRVFTFAPKEDQLRLFIWAEMAKLWPRFKSHFPTAELTDLRIRMDGTDEWGAWGYAVGVRASEDVATKAAGMHAEHMLLVYEETPGIPLPVMAAGENTCTAPHNLRVAIGNPDHQADALHKFCTSPGVRSVRMSSLDHPNVVLGDANFIPGAVSRKAIERRRQKYGEESRLFQSRVRGISPSEAEDALIKLAWCHEAAARYSDEGMRKGLPAMGVDVANSENGDLAAIALGLGSCLMEINSFQCPDASQLGVRVAAEMDVHGVLTSHVGVDAVGVGASTVNKLKELGKRIVALNSGSRPEWETDADLKREEGRIVVKEERYNNLRSQMWWQLRMDLQHGRIALPSDEELFSDITTPLWQTQSGKIVVEPKEKIKERLGRSPDKGDAVVYWNWVRHRQAMKEPEPELPHPSVYDRKGDKLMKDLAKQFGGQEKRRWRK